jgi:hypothetical protein
VHALYAKDAATHLVAAKNLTNPVKNPADRDKQRD